MRAQIPAVIITAPKTDWERYTVNEMEYWFGIQPTTCTTEDLLDNLHVSSSDLPYLVLGTLSAWMNQVTMFRQLEYKMYSRDNRDFLNSIWPFNTCIFNFYQLFLPVKFHISLWQHIVIFRTVMSPDQMLTVFHYLRGSKMYYKICPDEGH